MLPFLGGYPRPKIKEINSLPLEMLVIKEPCNLIGQEYFDLKPVNQNLPR